MDSRRLMLDYLSIGKKDLQTHNFNYDKNRNSGRLLRTVLYEV